MAGIAQKQTLIAASEEALSEACVHNRKAQPLHTAEQEEKGIQGTSDSLEIH